MLGIVDSRDTGSDVLVTGAVMLSGEMTLCYEGKTEVCRAGDIVTMRAGCEHEESFGAEGATYLVGRRQAAA